MAAKRSILFIGPEFFNFHQLIQERLREQGHTVYFVPDRPSKRAIVKILVRKARFLLNGYIFRHYQSIFGEIPEDIDEVFIIKGEALTTPLIRLIKERFTKARFQLYLWDSLRNTPGASSLISAMDRTWTFDYDDAKTHPNLLPIANFYIKSKEETHQWRHVPVRWNLSFFGTAHADRLKVLAGISESLPKDILFYRFIFFQSPLLYYVRRFFDPYFHKFPLHEMGFKPKLGKEWEEVAQASVAILDIHNPRQTGITIRAIECLASGMKLVTTNDRIRHYPFYDERLVHIIDRENPKIDPEFLRHRSQIEPPKAAKDLELSQWLKHIFSI